ncbi:MAG: hypothetical protein J6R67_03130 [Treponema sp.]|nr:hypothetical protein [Treponema sp.]
MNFDYNTLKRAAINGTKIGNWKGKSAFAASTKDLVNRGSGAFYILYDDNNKIVGYDTHASCWMEYGTVDEHGSVYEHSLFRPYKRVVAKKKKESVEIKTYPEPEKPIGDVKLEIDVDKTLKLAREMTIEGLLVGFLPGVDLDVAKG